MTGWPTRDGVGRGTRTGSPIFCLWRAAVCVSAEQERVRTRFIPSVVSSAFFAFLNAWRGGPPPDEATDWPSAVETEGVKAAGPDTVFLARFVAVVGVAGQQLPKTRLGEFLHRWRGDDQPELALKSVCSWAS